MFIYKSYLLTFMDMIFIEKQKLKQILKTVFGWKEKDWKRLLLALR